MVFLGHALRLCARRAEGESRALGVGMERDGLSLCVRAERRVGMRVGSRRRQVRQREDRAMIFGVARSQGKRYLEKNNLTAESKEYGGKGGRGRDIPGARSRCLVVDGDKFHILVAREAGRVACKEVLQRGVEPRVDVVDLGLRGAVWSHLCRRQDGLADHKPGRVAEVK